MKNFFYKLLAIGGSVLLILLALSYFFLGGGKKWEAGEVAFHPQKRDLKLVHEFEQPPGNIAVDTNGTIALCFHPEAKPDPKVILIDSLGNRKSLPNEWFKTVMSVRFDSENFLWTLDHGMHGTDTRRLLKIDINNFRIVQKIEISSEFAPFGSNLNDFQISPDSKFIYIADTSFVRNKPGIIIVDLEKDKIFRRLDNHSSVQKGPYAVSIDGHIIGFPPFLVMRPGIDSFVLDRNGEWLYYGSMSDTKLYRVRATDLTNQNLDNSILEGKVEFFANKPLSDGLTIDNENNIYVTEIQSHSVGVIDFKSRKYQRLLSDKRLEWPDGMSFGLNNEIYVTASYLHHVAFQAPKSWDDKGPFRIFKFKSLALARPGH